VRCVFKAEEILDDKDMLLDPEYVVLDPEYVVLDPEYVALEHVSLLAFQEELQNVAHLWNSHIIGQSRNAFAAGGRPYMM